MASTESSGPVNGNYAPQGYENSYNTGASNFTPSQQPTSQPAQQAPASEVPKDEVGWYFVEQYYTTLSRDPQKLWLYYNKRSQHVSGVEEEKVPVCVGQKHIKDRISELNFSNSKVRITNVDAQSSNDNILIQVLGDIAFSDASPRHFVQSFVLSQQPNGYFVLNDIFRYIKEEVEEEVAPEPDQELGTDLEEPAPTAAGTAGVTTPDEHVVDERQAAVVDKELEKIKSDETAHDTSAGAETNGTSAEDAEEKAADTPAPVEPESEITVPEEDPAADVIKEAAEGAEKAAHDTKPLDISADSSASQEQSSSSTTTAAPRPAVPKTWARMAASANTRVAMPVLPSSSIKPLSSVSQARSTSSTTEKAAAPPAPLAAAGAIPSAPSPQPTSSTPPAAREGSPDSAGWQSVGHDHSRKQSRSQAQTKQDESVRAYIKNVNTITTEELSNTLSQFGPLEYVDIDAAKSCAFVTFRNNAGFNAAVRANPHHIGEDEIYVEERKTRPFVQNAGQRGSVRGRGRGTFGGAERGGGRGGYPPRGGRGGTTGGTPQRGRGTSAA